MPKNLGELFYELRIASSSVSDDLEGAQKQLGKFTAFVKANPVAALTGLGVGFAGMAFEAAKAATAVESEMRKVTAILGGTREEAGALQRDLVELSLRTGESQQALASLFRSIAAGGPGGAENIRAIADAAITLSKVLGTDINVAAGGIDLITDIFRVDPSRAREVAAVLNQIASGRAPLEEVLDVLRKVGPSAQQAGISFETAAGAITTLLDQGQSTKAVSATFKELADRGAEGRVVLEGMAGAAVDVGQAMQRLNDDLRDAETSIDEVDKKIRAKLSAAWLKFGTEVSPSAGAALAFLTSLLDQQSSALEAIPGNWNRVEKAIRAAIDAKREYDRARTGEGSGPIDPSAMFGAPRPTFGPLYTNPFGANGTAGAGTLLRGLGGARLDQAIAPLTDASLTDIGEKFSDLRSRIQQTTNASAVQIRGFIAELKSMGREGAAFESVKEEALKLQQGLEKQLPAALERSRSGLEKLGDAARAADTQFARLLASFSSSAAGLQGVSDFGDVLRKGAAEIADFQRAAEKAGRPAEETAARVQQLRDALEVRVEGQLAEQLTTLTNRAASVRQSITAYAKEQKTLTDGRTADATATSTTIDLLAAEERALLSGAAAYRQFQKEQAQNAAVEQAIAKAKSENRTLTDTEIANVRFNAGFIFERSQRIAGLIEQMRQSAGGGLLDAFAGLAREATSIATSLGDGGESLARYAAVLSPLLTGLSGIQSALTSEKDPTKSVGLFTALSGGNGKEAQGKALAGSVAVIGAALQIADGALDLFGRQAKQRAEEMKVAARAFSLALQDFVAQANPEGPAGERIRALRRQAEGLAQQAAAAGGGSLKPGAFGDQVTSEKLREAAATLLADADRIAEVSPKVAAQLRTIAGGFTDLSGALEDAEEAAKEAVVRQLEDLEVRKLAAAGLSEDAARRREEIELQRARRAADDAKLDIDKKYTKALVAVIEAENAATEALRKRTAALRTLDESISVLGLAPQEALQATIGTLSNLSPQIAAIFDGIDLTTRDGLTDAQTRLRDLFRTLLADGVISEAEAPLVELIQRLLGSIQSVMDDLGSGLAEALDAEAIRAEVFGYTAGEQFAGLRNVLAGKFAELDAIFQDPTLQGTDNLGALKDTLQNKIAAILEGGITEDEAPLLAALRQLLGLVVEQIDTAADEAAAEAERIANEQAAARGTQRGRAGLRIQLYDLDGADAFRETLNGFGDSFANLFRHFDPRTQEGIDGASSRLASIFEQLATLTDDEILARFGMTRDELNAAIAQLDGDLDTLGDGLKSVAEDAQAAADAAKEFSDSLAVDYIRATQGDQAADLAAAAERRDEQLAQAKANGLGQSDLDKIETIYQDAVRRIGERYAPRETSADGSAGGSAPGTTEPRSRGRSTTLSGDIGGASELTVQTLAGINREIALHTSTAAAATVAILALLQGGLPAPPTSLLRFAGGLAGNASAGGGGIYIAPGAITVTLSGVNTAGLSPMEAGTRAGKALVDQLLRQMGEKASGRVSYLGAAPG